MSDDKLAKGEAEIVDLERFRETRAKKRAFERVLAASVRGEVDAFIGAFLGALMGAFKHKALPVRRRPRKPKRRTRR